MSAYTKDSNGTGLSIAQEVEGTPGTLPATPIWRQMEPNSYGDFGSANKTAPREVIKQDRQRRKGPLIDRDTSAAFASDFAHETFLHVMPGFMCADWRKKDELDVSAVTGTGYTVAAGGAAFVNGSLFFAQDFADAANNGLKLAAGTSTGTEVKTTGLVAAGGDAGRVTRVGVEAGAADAAIVAVGSRFALQTTTLALNALGVIPGEWVFVGGDAAATKFSATGKNGWHRVYSVSATQMVFDRWPDGQAADAGTGKTIRVFLGHVIKNESNPALQKFYTYQLERVLSDANIEYVKGAQGNTLAVNVTAAEKLTTDLNFMGTDTEHVAVLKSGTRPTLPEQVAFNSGADFKRLRVLNDTDGSVALATYMTDLKLSIDNGLSGNKAIGTVGSIDHTAADFKVSGSVEAYFTTIDAIAAIKANKEFSIDWAMVSRVGASNVGWLFDIPYVGMSDARLKVEKDKPIKLPLTQDAYAHPTLNHTLLAMSFAYLPALAS